MNEGRQTYIGAWVALLAGIVGILGMSEFFFATSASLVAILVGSHTLWLLIKHRRDIKGLPQTIIGFILGIIGLFIQAALWWLDTH